MRSTSLRGLVALGAVCCGDGARRRSRRRFADLHRLGRTGYGCTGRHAARGRRSPPPRGRRRHPLRRWRWTAVGPAASTGDAWSRFPIPIHAGAGTIQFQDAVVAGDRVWAVGTLRNDKPMAGWLAGDRWHWSTPVDPGGVEDEFLGVAALARRHPVGGRQAPRGGRLPAADRAVRRHGVDGRRRRRRLRGSAVLKDIVVDAGRLRVGGRVVGARRRRDPSADRAVDRRRVGDRTAAGDGAAERHRHPSRRDAIAVGWQQTPDGRPNPDDGARPFRLDARRARGIPAGSHRSRPARRSSRSARGSTTPACRRRSSRVGTTAGSRSTSARPRSSPAGIS